MSRFTGTPWMVYHPEYAPETIIGAFDDATDAVAPYRTICEVDLGNDDWDENRRLIIDAPTLYFLVRDLVRGKVSIEDLRSEGQGILERIDGEKSYTSEGHSADVMPF